MLVCDYQLIPNYPTYPHSHLLQPSLTPNLPSREKQIFLFLTGIIIIHPIRNRTPSPDQARDVYQKKEGGPCPWEPFSFSFFFLKKGLGVYLFFLLFCVCYLFLPIPFLTLSPTTTTQREKRWHSNFRLSQSLRAFRCCWCCYWGASAGLEWRAFAYGSNRTRPMNANTQISSSRTSRVPRPTRLSLMVLCLLTPITTCFLPMPSIPSYPSLPAPKTLSSNSSRAIRYVFLLLSYFFFFLCLVIYLFKVCFYLPISFLFLLI